MEKDFDNWNELQKQIHARANYLPLYYEREIRWCQLGVNVGVEQDGTGKGFSRPVLILKGLSRRACLIIPLTASGKKKHRHRLYLGRVAGSKAWALISQIRLIDVRRLGQHITVLDRKMFTEIRKTVKDFL